MTVEAIAEKCGVPFGRVWHGLRWNETAAAKADRLELDIVPLKGQLSQVTKDLSDALEAVLYYRRNYYRAMAMLVLVCIVHAVVSR